MVADDSYLCCAFLPSDRLCTKAGLLCSALPLVAMVLVPPLPHNSLRLGINIYHAIGSYTILPPVLMVAVPVLVLTSSFPNTNFGYVLGFYELPTPGLVTECRATSSLSLMLQPRLRYSVLTNPSLDVVLMMP